MRKTLTPLAGLLLISLSAQNTIQYSDLDPFGVATNMHLLTSPASIPTLSNGANQSWDLSSITLQNIGTQAFATAVGTPYAATYPTANWVWSQTVTGLGTGYTYLNITTSGIDLLARNVPISTVDFSDPSQVMKFPLSLGQSYSDTYVNTNGGSTMTWTYSGHGTAITPLGTFTNVAKVENTEGTVLLWSITPLYPIMIADVDNTLFFIQNNVGVNEHEGSAFQTWPNPCRDLLNLASVVNGSEWSILDAQGRTLSNGQITMGGDQQVDVSGLATGSYVLVLKAGDVIRHARFIKE
ncbi:MAG: T9SS type A sorting domain-containing protein [Flavobacteriales bacterium]